MYCHAFLPYSVFISIFLIFNATINYSTCTPVDTNADAKAIVDSKFDPKIVGGILPYRTQKECAEINKAIAPLNGGKALVDPKYIPLVNNKPYNDLLFALVNEPLTVFSMYLGHYLDLKDQDYFTYIYMQIEERMKFKEVYDSQHATKFKDACNKQKEPLLTALKAWTEADRADDGSIACQQGKWLIDEKSTWNDGPSGRNGLDGMLMKHTLIYARTGLRCYDENCPGFFMKNLETFINDKNLVKIYTALTCYIKDENDYLARLLHDHSDGKDNLALWIIVLTTRRSPESINNINSKFQDAFESNNMKDHILQSKAQFNVTKDMLAVLIDPKYKPSHIKPSEATPSPAPAPPPADINSPKYGYDDSPPSPPGSSDD